jgi:hypothetical protein
VQLSAHQWPPELLQQKLTEAGVRRTNIDRLNKLFAMEKHRAFLYEQLPLRTSVVVLNNDNQSHPVMFQLLPGRRSTNRRRLNPTVAFALERLRNRRSIHSKRVAKTRHNPLRLAMTPWLHRRQRSAGPKTDGLFCKLGLLLAYLCRSDISRAPGRCVGAPQPYAHQWILLEPRISHSLVPSNALSGFVQRRKLRLTRRRLVLDAVFVHLERLALRLLLVGLIARPSTWEGL